jgi:xanthine dehydrogenase accessory factor
MKHWLNTLATLTSPAILVTVANVVGSGPREPGAKMLVTPEHLFDTIGGGHLEMCATQIAREMLAMPAGSLAFDRRLERFPLGSSLGQCCGGVMHLAFERVDQNMLEHIHSLKQRWRNGQDSWRFTALDTSAAPTLTDENGKRLAGAEISAQISAHINPAIACQLLLDEHGCRWLIDACLAYKPQLMLFGAGHVGAAIVRAVADLPCQVTWVDEREDMFPANLPVNVKIEATDTPETLIASATPCMSFLVLTHSHALDQTLSEHILRRTDFSWFGLIGSHTKRALFERRLKERGIPAERLTQMVCPIGLPGIRGKQPAVIAASVAAQLLQVWEALELAKQRNISHSL